MLIITPKPDFVVTSQTALTGTMNYQFINSSSDFRGLFMWIIFFITDFPNYYAPVRNINMATLDTLQQSLCLLRDRITNTNRIRKRQLKKLKLVLKASKRAWRMK